MEGGNLELGPSISGRGAGWEPPVRARCKCGSMSYSQEYMEAFGVALCSACKRDDKLITKVGRARLRKVGPRRGWLPRAKR